MVLCKKNNILGSYNKGGFTLIELSIVIVIIGLIVAGIVGGQVLVKQAKLRGVISQINNYQIAHNSFLLEYGGIAGDLDNATAYWGGSVEDGNGNNRIEDVTNEVTAYWEHMERAGYISGGFAGLPIGGRKNVVGSNIPITRFSDDSGIAVNTQTVLTIYNKAPGSTVAFLLASESQSCNAWLNGILFTAKEAFSIDNKADDGIPYSGMYYTLKGVTSGSCAQHADCVTNDYTSPTTEYDFSNDNVSCRIHYWVNR